MSFFFNAFKIQFNFSFQQFACDVLMCYCFSYFPACGSWASIILKYMSFFQLGKFLDLFFQIYFMPISSLFPPGNLITGMLDILHCPMCHWGMLFSLPMFFYLYLIWSFALIYLQVYWYWFSWQLHYSMSPIQGNFYSNIMVFGFTISFCFFIVPVFLLRFSIFWFF